MFRIGIPYFWARPGHLLAFASFMAPHASYCSAGTRLEVLRAEIIDFKVDSVRDPRAVDALVGW